MNGHNDEFLKHGDDWYMEGQLDDGIPVYNDVMKNPRNISHESYYFDKGAEKFKRYFDLDRFHREVTAENAELREKIAEITRALTRLNELTKKLIYDNHWQRPIDEEPEYRDVMRLIGLVDEHNDPVAQDYDAVKDLEKENRNTGTLPF